MYTNQSAVPGSHHRPEADCQHAPCRGTTETCAYLQALARVREWVGRAEQAHASGKGERELMGRLWMLQAELSFALDHCTNVHGGDDLLVASSMPAQAHTSSA
jgi:hypothetical protein